MFVGTVIVYNQMKIQSERGFSIYLLEETDKFLVSMTRHAVADNFAIQFIRKPENRVFGSLPMRVRRQEPNLFGQPSKNLVQSE